jgi:hypothetical protein
MKIKLKLPHKLNFLIKLGYKLKNKNMRLNSEESDNKMEKYIFLLIEIDKNIKSSLIKMNLMLT